MFRNETFASAFSVFNLSSELVLSELSIERELMAKVASSTEVTVLWTRCAWKCGTTGWPWMALWKTNDIKGSLHDSGVMKPSSVRGGVVTVDRNYLRCYTRERSSYEVNSQRRW